MNHASGAPAESRGFPGGPRLRVAFLLAVAIGAFLLPRWWMVAAALVAMALAWLGLGLGGARLTRQLRKLLPICTLFVLGYALFAADPARDEWWIVDVRWFELELNAHGAMLGLAMALRIITVVLASHVARAGDPRALARGFRTIGMPRLAAAAIDATLALLEGGRGGGGGGRGRGGGGGGGGGGRGRAGITQTLRELLRGDVSGVVGSFERHLRRVERHLADADPDLPPHAIRDAAAIAAVALTMLGIKALKILPGIPFLPGYKGVVLIPLYLVAARVTHTRAGATLTGLTMGTVAFLLGDGRYGVFEIAKHVAPGVLVDLLYAPVAALAPSRAGRLRRVVAWSALGLVAAVGRFATITLIALAVQPPALVYAVLLPGLLVHAIFGVLSGAVTAPLLAALDNPAPESEPP